MSNRMILVVFCFFSLNLGAQTDWEKAAELRKAENYSRAEKLLVQYGSPVNFDTLKPADKIDFLHGMLELAHIRALKDDVSGALALLNWAEGRRDPYQRAIACVKYAEILIGLKEFERATAYLKNANELVLRQTTEKSDGTAIGQGGETLDLRASWDGLQNDIDRLQAEAEAEALKKKFGATYANYVKLRRLQTLQKRMNSPRYEKEALALIDEIVKNEPRSQFAAAAEYLRGEILFSRLTESSPDKEIKAVKEYLNKFVRRQPDGLYRGEALMLLGKISMEREWNAPEAEKYYLQALEYFRKSRERKDAVSLYTTISGDLQQQAAPSRKMTSIDSWRRLIVAEEDPLKLYNVAATPPWYIDDKEMNCLFIAGFFHFMKGRYEAADECWRKAGSLDDSLRQLQNLKVPNLIFRLRGAVRQKFIVATPDEFKKIPDSEKLRVLFAEYSFIGEKWDDAFAAYQYLAKNAGRKNPEISALALNGMADVMRMNGKHKIEEILQLYRKVLTDDKLRKTASVPRALYGCAWTLHQSADSGQNAQAEKLLIQCAEKYRKTLYGQASLFYLTLMTVHSKPDRSRRYLEDFRFYYSDSPLVAELERSVQILNKKQKSTK